MSEWKEIETLGVDCVSCVKITHPKYGYRAQFENGDLLIEINCLEKPTEVNAYYRLTLHKHVPPKV